MAQSSGIGHATLKVFYVLTGCLVLAEGIVLQFGPDSVGKDINAFTIKLFCNLFPCKVSHLSCKLALVNLNIANCINSRMFTTPQTVVVLWFICNAYLFN